MNGEEEYYSSGNIRKDVDLLEKRISKLEDAILKLYCKNENDESEDEHKGLYWEIRKEIEDRKKARNFFGW